MPVREQWEEVISVEEPLKNPMLFIRESAPETQRYTQRKTMWQEHSKMLSILIPT